MANTKRPADYAGVTVQQFMKYFDEVVQLDQFSLALPFGSASCDTVRTLFQIALSDMNGLFPNASVKVTSSDPKDYISKWIGKYVGALVTPPSQRVADLPKSATDPALGVMVQQRQNLTDDQLIEKIHAHQLFMSAENVQGNLLEEYIASVAEPQGWIWARGETLRACDFVKPGQIITSFVQIKNRDNTENSSSQAIRQGTQIRKWNRLKTRRKDGKPYPVFMWEKLNELMELSGEVTSEAGYRGFLRNVIQKNPNIIRSLE
ncbi:SinI family restriction endonuclease [Lacticaseibacillus porcinae]|uniref:SinI family restriction endonuclease n=1 Tax=Lacticaseibacillus porcinae TaxID=1123687 RepID=UPI000F7A9650|nr:SinI family restriction endonuclease [Lacticaseibacillus porcinae]